jgi:dTDP-4-amino-4,6-dideoxygalactose transaminase
MKKIPRFMPSATIDELIQASFLKKKEGYDYWLREFSNQFAEYIGISFAVPVPLARTAFAGAIYGLQLPQGGEIILPSLTFHGIVEIVQSFGLRPKFIDINPDTYCMEIEQLEKAITSSTVAIVPVHLYGRACNMDVIIKIAQKYNLKVIEDCAQSCGAIYRGKRLGGFGQAAIFSFGPHKNISVLGMGMLATNSKKLADRANFWLKKFSPVNIFILIKQILYTASLCLATQPLIWDNILVPMLKLGNYMGVDLIELLTDEYPSLASESINTKNWRMPRSLHGKVGLSQLKKIDELNCRRIYNGNKLIESLKNIERIKVPSIAPNGENIYSTLVIRVQNRQKFRRRMLSLGVDTHGGNMFVGPHLPGLKSTGECRVAAEAVKQMVHLPVYPQMSQQDLNQVVEAVKNCVV